MFELAASSSSTVHKEHTSRPSSRVVALLRPFTVSFTMYHPQRLSTDVHNVVSELVPFLFERSEFGCGSHNHRYYIIIIIPHGTFRKVIIYAIIAPNCPRHFQIYRTLLYIYISKDGSCMRLCYFERGAFFARFSQASKTNTPISSLLSHSWALQNFPLYLRTAPGHQDGEMQFHHIIHTAIDVIEEKSKTILASSYSSSSSSSSSPLPPPQETTFSLHSFVCWNS